MTPKEKALKWMDNYTNKVIISKEDVIESVDIAIKAERKRTLDEVDKLLFDKHYHKKVYVRYKISGAELKRLRQIGER